MVLYDGSHRKGVKSDVYKVGLHYGRWEELLDLKVWGWVGRSLDRVRTISFVLSFFFSWKNFCPLYLGDEGYF